MIIKTIRVNIFPEGSFETNCYLVADPKSKEGLIIDPGAQGEKIIESAKKQDMKILYIVNTHAHFDHIGADEIVKEAFGAEILVHSMDEEMMKSPELNFSCMGTESKSPNPDRLLEDNEEISLGETTLKILHTPGHTPGGICLLTDNEIFTGDTLFAGSVGRTDLPGGSYEQLMSSIEKRLKPLPGYLKVYPGHGPATTMEEEKANNPYMQ
ncbi:MAG: MBL fold metallo-hydrolase [Clostridia bacterium]|nr:MBL fold metallo-hydrolase [Clostridia bacterium]